MAEFMITRDDTLQHFGIKGQKWGVRRYENEDGTLTEAGKKRYAKAEKAASEEKISGKQMVKNAVKRAAVGAAVGTAAERVANTISTADAFRKGNKINFFGDASKFKDGVPEGYTLKDLQDGHLWTAETGFHTENGRRITDYSKFFTDVNYRNPGEALHLYQRMTENILKGPAIGALAGAGVGALGSVTVDSLHNLKINRAKNFVAKYQEAYNKTYGGNSNG